MSLASGLRYQGIWKVLTWKPRRGGGRTRLRPRAAEEASEIILEIPCGPHSQGKQVIIRWQGQGEVNNGEERQGDLLHDVEDGCQDCSAARRGHRVEGQVVSGDREYQRLLDDGLMPIMKPEWMLDGHRFKCTVSYNRAIHVLPLAISRQGLPFAICKTSDSVTCEMLDASVGQWCTLQEERPGQAASRLCKHSGRSLWGSRLV